MVRLPLRARDGSVRAYAIVDEADYEWASRWRWCYSKGYAVRNRPGRGKGHIFLHRALMGEPDCQVDHHNRDRLDCRRSNLRFATRNELDNAQNQGPKATNPTHERGVHRLRGRFRARVKIEYREHHIGVFDTVEDAAAAVRAFRAEHMPFSAEASAT